MGAQSMRPLGGKNRIVAVLLCKMGYLPQERQSEPAFLGALLQADVERGLCCPGGNAAGSGKRQTAARKVDARCGKPRPPRALRDVRPITSRGKATPANFEGEGASFPGGPEHFHLDLNPCGRDSRPWRRRSEEH